MDGRGQESGQEFCIGGIPILTAFDYLEVFNRWTAITINRRVSILRRSHSATSW